MRLGGAFLIGQRAAQRDVVHQQRLRILTIGHRRRKGLYRLGQLLFQLGDALLRPLNLARFFHHGSVRLELRKRLLDEPQRVIETEHAQQVDGHVVPRGERGIQRVGARGGKACHLPRIHGRRPQHDRVALRVDATPARAPRQLRVLPRREIHVRLAIKFDELFQHHRARRHVDPQRERLSGEDGPHQPAHEEIFHNVAKCRQHTGVVGGETAGEHLAPLPEVKHLEILFRDAFHPGIDDLFDLLRFLRLGQAHPRAVALVEGAVAAGAGEDEGDGRQHLLPLQELEHLRPAEGAVLVLRARRAAAPAGIPALLRALVALGQCTRAKALPGDVVGFALVGIALLEALDALHQFRVDLAGRARLEKWVDLVPDEHPLVQRDRAMLGDDDLGIAAHGRKPLAEFLGVRHRGR